MGYINRQMEKTFVMLAKEFPVLLLTGPRQVGKTTMLKKLALEENIGREYVNLDNLEDRELAKKDPKLFLQLHRAPVLIDEVQYAPELLTYIKIAVDENYQPGAFWLTGSQLFKLMEGVQESLAGRVALLQLSSLAQSEMLGLEQEPFVLDLAKLQERTKQRQPVSMESMYETIFQGGMPALVSGKYLHTKQVYGSYLSTYVERDIRELSGGIDALKFMNFITAAAALVGQVLNYKTIADLADISVPTVKNWLLILERLGIIFYLHPYSNNLLKRTITKPKLYFYDTGLVAYLTKWSDAQTLMSGAMSGAILENFTVTEICKSYLNYGLIPNMYYYRDRDAKEIDVVMEQDGKLYPMEIKKSALPDVRWTHNFQILDKATLERGTGAVLCMNDRLSAFNRENYIVPIWSI